METFSIPSCDHHPIAADVYPADGGRAVVMCHGFKGHRRWGFIPGLAARLAEGGITAVAMDFSLNGRRGAGSLDIDEGFPAPEAFRRNTLAREVDDLNVVVRWVRDNGLVLAGASPGLWGHSRGGVVAMLAALDDPGITALVTWSIAAQPDFYTAHQKAQWREKGAFEFTDHATGTPLAIDVGYLDDLEENASAYALANRAGGLRAAQLIVHGEHDMVIPVSEAVRLYDTPEIAADKKLLRLATGHTFGSDGGEDDTPSEALVQASRATLAWFDEYLPSAQESS